MSDPRCYQDETDFTRMQALLADGRQAHLPAYYIHTGDLAWWFHYHLPEDDLRPVTRLWESNGRLEGFVILDTGWGANSQFVHPSLYGTPRAEEMLAWTTAEALGMFAQAGKPDVLTLWVAEEDAWFKASLEQLGYERSPRHLNTYLSILLEAPIPEPILPEGYSFRSPSLAEAEVRAAAQYAAFEGTMPIDQYYARYRRFMQSKVYPGVLDLMVVAPDGRCAAFCICWQDSQNQVTNFEPVGTHPDFQRKGLGKALLYEALHRLPALGMRTAVVGTGSDNLPAIGLYQAAGFTVYKQLLTYAKKVEQ